MLLRTTLMSQPPHLLDLIQSEVPLVPDECSPRRCRRWIFEDTSGSNAGERARTLWFVELSVAGAVGVERIYFHGGELCS